jgi:DNA polymerase-3 subunit epsilon
MALVLESVEIKRLWPEFNRSQKGFEHTFALYSLEDQNGMIRLAVEKKRKHLPAIHTFHKLEEGYSLARKAAALSGVEENYIFAFTQAPALNIVDRAHHNSKMREAIRFMQDYLPTYAVLQDGRNEKGEALKVAYLIEKGKFVGLSYIGDEANLQGYQAFKAGLTLYPDYDAARSMLISYAAENPDAVFRWD